MWYVIVVDDPKKYQQATGDQFDQGAICSVGTDIADEKTLAARGLVAVACGDTQPDWSTHDWDADALLFVEKAEAVETKEETKDRIRAELAELTVAVQLKAAELASL